MLESYSKPSTMNAGGIVLLVEMVIPPPGVAHFGKLLDLEMLVVTENGKERTEPEFAALLSQAGLKLTRLVPTMSPVCIIEAKKL